MNLQDKLFDYLSKKIKGFQKITKKGQFLFTCPRINEHKFSTNNPTATFIPSSDKINCLICGWKGNMFDAVRLIEPDKKDKSDAEIISYLIEELKLDMYIELTTYQNYGWSLIPLLNNSKIPFEKDWVNTEHREKTTWIKWLNNGLNIGLNCSKSNVTVIDIDLKVAPAQELEQIYKKINECKTLTANTPHGKHFVFQFDKDLQQCTNLGGLHIDIRNTGGQIVIAPSKIDNLEYKWVNLGIEIKQIPEDIKTMLLSFKQIGNEKKSSSEIIIPEVEKIKEGEGRNNTLTSMGGALINKFSIEDTTYILSLISNNFFKPPLPYHEIKGMLGSLSTYKVSESESHEKAIYEYLKLIQNDVSAKDIMESLKLSRAIIDKYLSKFVKEGKAIRLGRGRYQYKEKIDWTDATPEVIEEYQYKMPLFNNIALFQDADCLILGGKTNEGKCLTNGYLTTNYGLIDIADFGNKKHDGISIDKGKHIKLFTGKLQDKSYRSPNYFWKEKVKETIKISTEYGYELEATPNHKIMTIVKNFNNGQYKTEFKALKDIQKNEEILIVSPKHFAGNIKQFKKDYWYKKSLTSNPKKLVKSIKEITPELARLIGYIIGDGSLDKNSIHIYTNSKTEKNTIAKDIKLIVNIYGLKPNYTIENNCLKISINSSILLKWFKQRVLKQSTHIKNIKSPDRYVPKCILQGNEEIQRNFIGALFSCESSLGHGTSLELTMASKKIIDVLHIMLLNFGIFCKKEEKIIKKYKNNKYYKIFITSEFGLKFLNIFNPIKYEHIKLLKNIKRKSKIKTFGNNQFYKDAYFIDKIISKIYLNEEKYVYDFNIENKKYSTNNQFWCNGFVNHNTTIALNILKEMIEQDIKPYYVYNEAGSRFQKIAKLLEIEGKFFHCQHANPLAVELEPNSFTIIDWLCLENKAETDTTLKHLNDELQRKRGILIIFTQLKQNYEWFAPNLIDHFPTFAARYIQDNENHTEGHWDISKIKEPRGNFCTYILPCMYDHQTRIFKIKDLI